jgi:hypothetical protein
LGNDRLGAQEIQFADASLATVMAINRALVLVARGVHAPGVT